MRDKKKKKIFLFCEGGKPNGINVVLHAGSSRDHMYIYILQKKKNLGSFLSSYGVSCELCEK